MYNYNSKTIWIDLDNSPHVLFFAPIRIELEKLGYFVFITVRQCFQVCGLADLHDMKYQKIGKHYGKHKVFKGAGTILRALQLYKNVATKKPIIAISHGSRSQLIAAKIMDVPTITISDYEHAQGLPFVSPDVLLVPEIVSVDLNWRAKKICKYPGIKEYVYLSEFAPDKKILKELGIKDTNVIATIRPPATEAHYHNSDSERLFCEVVSYLGTKEKLQMVILPRNEKVQGDYIRSKWTNWCEIRKIIIPNNVVDGPNLIWHSDLVISGGGTMNREAAALGVPVYSIFRGKIGAVDRYLNESKRLTLIQSIDDIKNKILPIPREKSIQKATENKKSLLAILDVIEKTIETQNMRCKDASIRNHLKKN